MAALVPLNNPDALSRFHEAGVEEVYVGFHDDAFLERFGADAELNRMSGFGAEANPFGFREMLGHIGRAAALGMRAFVCFNASAYTAEQDACIAREYLPPIREAGAAGVIVSSIGLAPEARAAGLGVVVSTIAGAFNARLASYYRDHGATRLILPRDLSVDEIAQIVEAVPELEYEVFLMRNGCMFSDSHCLGCHRAGMPSLCLSLREGSVFVRQAGFAAAHGADSANAGDFGDAALLERAWETERVLNESYHRRTCGLCALWRFERLGISAYKVVGRGDDVDDLCFDAGLVVRNAALARSCASEREYFAKMELPREPGTLCGNRGLSCYYPEISRT